MCGQCLFSQTVMCNYIGSQILQTLKKHFPNLKSPCTCLFFYIWPGGDQCLYVYPSWHTSVRDNWAVAVSAPPDGSFPPNMLKKKNPSVWVRPVVTLEQEAFSSAWHTDTYFILNWPLTSANFTQMPPLIPERLRGLNEAEQVLEVTWQLEMSPCS